MNLQSNHQVKQFLSGVFGGKDNSDQDLSEAICNMIKQSK